MNVLALTPFGSNLYGTSVPFSDIDYRGVYLPELSDCVMNRIKDTQDKSSYQGAAQPALDITYFSLQKLVSMALEGQSVAIEMLCAEPMISSPIWCHLQTNRKRFFTKQMASFMGYAKSMSSRYSVRIDRLHETEAILGVLEQSDDPQWLENTRLGAIWDSLPVSVNCEKATDERISGEDKRLYRVCGRDIHARVRVGHALGVIQDIHDAYGERVKNVASGNIDWKALAHAFRAALQCKEIVETGDLRFPLRDAPFLRSLRLGEYHFVNDSLDKRLDDLISEVQSLLDASNLPDTSDRAFGESIIMRTYNL